ncbi:MAG: hypothetical protein IK143_08325 [Bacteroidales bacterium]|nr:hypothetical protein [Bacteroidales bacterium]
MKKIYAFAAVAAFLFAGAIKLYAESYYYGFLTSCGYEECVELSFQPSDDFLATHLEVLEAEHCGGN